MIESHKRILCYSPYATWALHTFWESTILQSLKLRGFEVKYVLCDGIYWECDLFNINFPKRNPRSCINCQISVIELFKKLGIDFRWVGEYIEQQDFDNIHKWIKDIDINDYIRAEYNGWKVGEWVRSSVHTFFGTSFIDLQNFHIQEIYRNFLYSGVVACIAISRLLEDYKPDILFLFNGRLSSTRIAFELARNRNIYVVCHERGLIFENLCLFKDVNCLSLMPFKDLWREWGNIPLTYVELEKIDQYLKGREYGKYLNWKAFTPPPQDLVQLQNKLGLNSTRPLWVLFTSSEDEVAAAEDWRSPFASQMDWIQKTINYIKHHPEIDLVIKVHPNSSENNIKMFEEMLQRCHPLPLNIKVIMPNDPISSYSLMELATIGLIFQSTTGLEMACKGKNVLVASECWISNLPFVKTVESAEIYEKMLDEMVEVPLLMKSVEIQRMAYRYAYGIFFRLNIPFPLVKMPNPYSGILAYNSIEQLLPGLEPNLDRACRIILEKEPVCPPPSEKDLIRDEKDEIEWFRDREEARRRALTEYEKKKQSIYQETPPRISVIILCYNQANYLERAVKSVIDQVYKNFEIIIVNDGSTDNTQEITEYLIATHPDYLFELINQPNAGHPAISYNNGISKARGTYILCMSANQVLAPHFLNECVTFLDANPQISIACPTVQQFGVIYNLLPPSEYNFETLKNTNNISSASLFRKKAWEDVGGFDIKANGNVFHKFWIACGEQKHFGHPVPRAIVFDYISKEEIEHIDNLIKSRKFLEADLALKYIIERYPESPDIINLQLILKLQMNDREGAKSILLNIINRWPADYVAYGNLACIYWDTGDFENAAKYFEDALRISQFERSVVMAFGEMLMSYKKYAKAKEIFEDYLRINPADSEVQALLKKCKEVIEKADRLSMVIEKKEVQNQSSVLDHSNPSVISEIRELKFISAEEYLKKNSSNGTSFEIARSNLGDTIHKMYVLSDFILAGPLGFPISKDGDVIKDKFIYFDVFSKYLNNIPSVELFRKLPEKKEGKYLPLYGDWAEGFWHWMTENLPYVMIAENSGYDGYYIIPPTSHARQSMELLGIKPDRILEYHGGHWYIETLYLPQRVAGQALIHYPDILLSLRQRLLNTIAPSAKETSPKRIYISRNKLETQRRIIVNEDALLKLLAPYGFETVYMEKMSLKEQIALMAGANTLITPHGAGTIHTLFMPLQSLVIELFSPIYINPVALPAIDLLKHKYFMIPGHFDSPRNPVYNFGHNIEAFLEVIEITLKRELGAVNNLKT